MKKNLIALLKRLRTRFKLLGKKSFMTVGKNLHICKGGELWAPDFINIGDDVYIGKSVIIETNTRIGNYVLIANSVNIIGRSDHNHKEIGIPIRFSSWIGNLEANSNIRENYIDIEDDVWVGAGAILLSPIKIGRGSIIASGSVVVKNVEPYSIVGGNPAKKIGVRFNEKEIVEHEYKINHGQFRFDARGLSYSIIKPGKFNDKY
jgi:acetyltransferase-like isoleucine patch superfamily enzyme